MNPTNLALNVTICQYRLQKDDTKIIRLLKRIQFIIETTLKIGTAGKALKLLQDGRSIDPYNFILTQINNDSCQTFLPIPEDKQSSRYF